MLKYLVSGASISAIVLAGGIASAQVSTQNVDTTEAPQSPEVVSGSNIRGDDAPQPAEIENSTTAGAGTSVGVQRTNPYADGTATANAYNVTGENRGDYEAIFGDSVQFVEGDEINEIDGNYYLVRRYTEAMAAAGSVGEHPEVADGSNVKGYNAPKPDLAAIEAQEQRTAVEESGPFYVRTVQPGLEAAVRRTVYFEFDEADLEGEEAYTVDQLANDLQTGEIERVILEGHTDTVATDEYNWDLSRARAVTVAQELESQGVDPDKIYVYWAGEYQPAVETGEGVRAQANRRVEITAQ